MGSKNIVAHFRDLPDPREDNRRHLLIDIIVIVICASVCGAEKWDDIEAVGRAKEAWLRRFLTLPHGIPSHDTIAWVFSRINPEALNDRFVAWVSVVNPNYARQTVNTDGKTLRRSRDEANGKSATHIISAWENQAGLTLAQIKVEEKSNEITAIPELLKMLELSGCVVESQRIIGDQTSTHYLYYISSLPADAEHFAHLVRAHWRIENSLHWVLDVAFREDECRKRKDYSAENFAVLRHITHNLLKQEKTCKRGIACERLLAGWNASYMEKVQFDG